MCPDAPPPTPPTPPGVRIGLDLVRIERVERSLADFGDRFTRRIFAPGELRAATVDGRLDARALAARFAAKEAAIKAFDLAEAGVGWSQLEVVGEGPQARMVLAGRAAECAAAGGTYEIAVSLRHAGAHAGAVVVALPASDRDEERANARVAPEGAREGQGQPEAKT